MARTGALITGLLGTAAALAALGFTAQPEPREPAAREPGKALMVMTGRSSEVRTESFRIASSQALFDKAWLEHMGEGVEKAAQGWPMPPRVDFTACEVVFVFGGDRVNCNGYRVEDIIEVEDAVTIRYDAITFQTASFGGEPDEGVKARPWAMVLIPATEKTVFLEENVQGLIGGDPVWKQRVIFPGAKGVGRPIQQIIHEQPREGG